MWMFTAALFIRVKRENNPNVCQLVNEWKKNVNIHPYSGILLSDKGMKCRYMLQHGEPPKLYGKWKKPDTFHIICSMYMKNSEKGIL